MAYTEHLWRGHTKRSASKHQIDPDRRVERQTTTQLRMLLIQTCSCMWLVSDPFSVSRRFLLPALGRLQQSQRQAQYRHPACSWNQYASVTVLKGKRRGFRYISKYQSKNIYSNQRKSTPLHARTSNTQSIPLHTKITTNNSPLNDSNVRSTAPQILLYNGFHFNVQTVKFHSWNQKWEHPVIYVISCVGEKMTKLRSYLAFLEN